VKLDQARRGVKLDQARRGVQLDRRNGGPTTPGACGEPFATPEFRCTARARG